MQSGKLSVAFIRTTSGEFTGTSKMILRLVDGIGDDFEPIIICQKDCPLLEQARERNLQTEVIPYRGVLDNYGGSLLSPSPLQFLRMIFRIGQYNFDAHRVLSEADIIWCDTLRTLLTLAPTAILSDTPVIWNVGLGEKSEGIYAWLNEVCFRLADHVFIESELQAERLYGKQFDRHRQKFTIFYKGIKIDRFATSTESEHPDGGCEPLTIGTAGTLTERKGHHTALEALARFQDEHPDLDFTYRIAGGTSHPKHREYEAELRRQISRLGLEDVVEFCGWVDSEDMPEFYQSLDVFILASSAEGIAGVIREAMASGCAVIATDVGGNPEAITDGETGRIVPPDSPDAIADALSDLASNPRHRREIAESGCEYTTENFSVETYVDRYADFLRRVAARQ